MGRFGTRWLYLALALSCAAPAAAQQTPVPAPAEPDAIPLYGDKTPGSAATEIWARPAGGLQVRNVTRPTLTPFLPAPGKATGAAVIVAPGGGFMILSMEWEGSLVARSLADRGIAAFVLKYRLIATPKETREFLPFMARTISARSADPTKMPALQHADATSDALAALALVRSHAARWRIDPKRVGMIGFSAGARTTINAVLAAQPGKGPDFFGYIYGPQGSVEVPAGAPPMFNAIALDDPLFPTAGFPIVESWRAAKRPVELHAYQRGGHGFGLGVGGTTTTQMLDEFITWMTMNGFQRQVQKAPAP